MTKENRSAYDAPRDRVETSLKKIARDVNIDPESNPAQYDTFRHAYASALVYQILGSVPLKVGETTSWALGHLNE